MKQNKVIFSNTRKRKRYQSIIVTQSQDQIYASINLFYSANLGGKMYSRQQEYKTFREKITSTITVLKKNVAAIL